MENKLVKNTLYKFILNLFRFTLPVMILPYIYRVLGAKNMGIINFSEGVYSYFNIFVLMGIYECGVKEISQHRNSQKKNEIFSELFLLNIFTTIIFVIVYILIVQTIFRNTQYYLILTIFTFKMVLIHLNLEWINEGMEDYKFISLKSIICRSISLFLMYLLINSEKDVWLYALLNVFFDFISNIATLYYIFIKKKYVKLKIKKYDFYRKLKIVFVIMLMTQSGILYFQFDKIILGLSVGEVQVSYYNLAERLIVIVASLLITFNQVTFPRLSKLVKESKEEYLNLLDKIIDLGLLVIIPSVVGLFMLDKKIIFIFAGEQYMAGVQAFRVFIIYIILYFFINVLSRQILFLFDKSRFVSIVMISVGVLNVIVKYLLMGNIDAKISIMITLFFQFVVICILYLYIRKRLDLNIKLFKFNYLKYIIFSGIFYSINVYFVERLLIPIALKLIVIIIVSATIYTSLLILSKDKIILEILISRIRKE